MSSKDHAGAAGRPVPFLLSRGQRVFVGVLALAAVALTVSVVWHRPKPAPPPATVALLLGEMALPGATAQGAADDFGPSLAGRVWVADFVFTRCSGPCPMITRRMSDLVKSAPPETRFVTFTVDPEGDTLESLRRYARRWKADPRRWFFVRLEPPALHRWMKEGFRLPMVRDPEAPEGERVVHSSRFVLVDRRGSVRGFFDSGDDLEVKGLLSELERLGKESA